MSQVHRVLLHSQGPALWPDHKPEAEVMALKATTPALVWSGTYQGVPTPPGGHIFRRSMWHDKNRYDPDDRRWAQQVVARWLSFDTASKDEQSAASGNPAYTACVVGELTADYKLAISWVWRDRVEFPHLPKKIERAGDRFVQDGKLRGIIIEDKSTGTSAYQTLKASSTKLKHLLVAYNPKGDKVQRATQASVWCENGSIMLPYPSPSVPWLLDFTDELFDFPQSDYADQVDAFSQLVIYTENLLEAGLLARQARKL